MFGAWFTWPNLTFRSKGHQRIHISGIPLVRAPGHGPPARHVLKDVIPKPAGLSVHKKVNDGLNEKTWFKTWFKTAKTWFKKYNEKKHLVNCMLVLNHGLNDIWTFPEKKYISKLQKIDILIGTWSKDCKVQLTSKPRSRKKKKKTWGVSTITSTSFWRLSFCDVTCIFLKRFAGIFGSIIR